jgi:hypothetical protein
MPQWRRAVAHLVAPAGLAVVTRCLGFGGVYLGGHMSAGSCPHHAAEDGRQ